MATCFFTDVVSDVVHGRTVLHFLLIFIFHEIYTESQTCASDV